MKVKLQNGNVQDTHVVDIPDAESYLRGRFDADANLRLFSAPFDFPVFIVDRWAEQTLVWFVELLNDEL